MNFNKLLIFFSRFKFNLSEHTICAFYSGQICEMNSNSIEWMHALNNMHGVFKWSENT